MKKKSYVYLAVIIIVIGLLIFFWPNNGNNGAPGKYDEFAQCLSDSGTVMYGAYWCSHCAAQKKMFGSSFKYVNYVECDPRGDNANPDLCDEKGVQGFPTWEFPDGSFASGEQILRELASKSGCTLPEDM